MGTNIQRFIFLTHCKRQIQNSKQECNNESVCHAYQNDANIRFLFIELRHSHHFWFRIESLSMSITFKLIYEWWTLLKVHLGYVIHIVLCAPLAKIVTHLHTAPTFSRCGVIFLQCGWRRQKSVQPLGVITFGASATNKIRVRSSSVWTNQRCGNFSESGRNGYRAC